MTAPRRVLRYVVPIDDHAHEIAAGYVVMAAPRRGEADPVRNLEVWVETEVLSHGEGQLGDPRAANAITPTATCDAQVFGTGQMLPDDAEHLASCINGPLVWHLYEVEAP